MKAINTILDMIRNHDAASCGNHCATKIKNIIRCYYFGHLIAVIDVSNHKIFTSHCGWFTSTTTRAINCYVRMYNHFAHIIAEKDIASISLNYLLVDTPYIKVK